MHYFAYFSQLQVIHHIILNVLGEVFRIGGRSFAASGCRSVARFKDGRWNDEALS